MASLRPRAERYAKCQGRCTIEGCERVVEARGWCVAHYTMWRLVGDPLGSARTPAPERFWSHVEKRGPDDCWLWTAAVRGANGYGAFRTTKEDGSRGRMVAAHRYAWELANGPVPDGLVVMHACDTPLCVNQSHLSVGTHLDNNRDMWTKGRARPTAPYHHAGGSRKRTEVAA